MGKAWRQEPEAAGHMATAVQEAERERERERERGGDAGAQFILSFFNSFFQFYMCAQTQKVFFYAVTMIP